MPRYSGPRAVPARSTSPGRRSAQTSAMPGALHPLRPGDRSRSACLCHMPLRVCVQTKEEFTDREPSRLAARRPDDGASKLQRCPVRFTRCDRGPVAVRGIWAAIARPLCVAGGHRARPSPRSCSTQMAHRNRWPSHVFGCPEPGGIASTRPRHHGRNYAASFSLTARFRPLLRWLLRMYPSAS